MPPKRELNVLTRKEGVRKENPLMTVGDYYISSNKRTPALREEADNLLAEEEQQKKKKKLGMTIVNNAVNSRLNK